MSDALTMFASLLAVRGVAIKVIRGTASGTLMATRGKSVMVVDEGEGRGIIQVTSHDFIVRARDLVLSGSQIVPAKGDKIQFAGGGLTYTYQLMTPPFDPSDHEGDLLRLHSKQISVA
jgi:hypothetical protein